MADAAPLWTADQIATAVAGEKTGDFSAFGVTFDSREVQPGDLFVALVGMRDGHEFLDGAFSAGAAGALVSKSAPGPSVKVADTLKGLENLGRAARDRSAALRCAVTGSVGKTSVTQAIAAGLARAGRWHSSVKSYNNHIGVPLTLARMRPETERAVFEIGMNHMGEITPLSRMVEPDVVVITTVGPVHTENFEDGEAGVARAKAEVFDGLKPGGIAILNADNAWFDLLAEAGKAAGADIRTFGQAAFADARLIAFEGGAVDAVVHGKPVRYALLQSGDHWGATSLCVLLALEAMNVSQADAIAALEAFEPLAGRGAVREVAGVTLIDESYNANPISMASAIRALGARPAAGRRIAVLSDMLELGPKAAEFHAALAEDLVAAEVDAVYAAGPLMKSLWDALPATRQGGYAVDADALAPQVVKAVRPGDVVMIKGSNGSRARVVAAALAALGTAQGDG